jgi:hypothetical protein
VLNKRLQDRAPDDAACDHTAQSPTAHLRDPLQQSLGGARREKHYKPYTERRLAAFYTPGTRSPNRSRIVILGTRTSLVRDVAEQNAEEI